MSAAPPELRLLLVEDNDVDAMIFARMAELAGWSVARAASLGEAEELVEEHGPGRFGVVVVDLGVPDAAGLESVRFARSTLPDAPCVVVTGEADLRTADDALRDGAADYLVKGEMTPRMVAQTLRHVVDHDRSVRATLAAERNLRAVLAAHPDAVLVVDEAGGVRFHNRASEPYLPVLLDPASGALAEPTPPPGEQRRTLALEPGRVAHVVLQVRSVSWASEPATMLLFRDVSLAQEVERLRAELEAAVDRGQRENARDWHEVKNLVHGLMTSLDGLPATAQAQRALGAAQGVLAVALRQMEGRVPATAVKRRVDLAAVCEAIVLSAERSGADAVVFQRRLGPVAPVLGDPVALHAAVTDLVHNAVAAVRALPAHQRRVALETLQDAGWVRVVVEDAGPGVDRAVRERLFREAVTTKAYGTGRGLVEVAATATEHGGEVRFEDVPGGGTRFVLSLPAAARVRASRGLRVLVVDDVPDVRATAVRMLGGTYDVFTASDGAEALAVLRRDPDVHAVICDLNMPGVDGLQVLAALRAEGHPTAERFVFCTGGPSSAAVAAALEETGRPLLFKPYRVEDLIEAVERVAGGAS